MLTVLEQGKPLTFDVGLIQLSFIPVCSLKYMQHFSQIVPRVCTSVLFINGADIYLDISYTENQGFLVTAAEF